MINEYMTIGLLVAGITFVSQIMTSTKNINLKINTIGINLNSYDRIQSFIKIIKEDSVNKMELSSRVVFDNVSFKYDENLVLSNISFDIPLKGILIINGENGSGKTTLTNLILGLEKPTADKIFINNIDSKNYSLDFIYNNFSCVFQKGVLFNNSAIDNIIFYNQWDETRHNKINGLEFFRKIKDITVNSNGEGLSGGEKKRILFARALYKKFNILILDENDSGVDKEGYEEFISIIKELSKEKLIVVISHKKDENFKNFADYTITLKKQN